MLGGNGAGKTTTINIFLNFYRSDGREARIEGFVTHREHSGPRSMSLYVSEHVMLYTNFTAIQNLEYFAKLGGKYSYTRDDYREALMRVGLPEEAHNKRLKTYSKGMRQKCGIAIAILKDARAILLDDRRPPRSEGRIRVSQLLLPSAPKGRRFSCPPTTSSARRKSQTRSGHHEPRDAGHAAAKRASLPGKPGSIYLNYMAGSIEQSA